MHELRHPIRAALRRAHREAYWRVVLTNGKSYSELDMVRAESIFDRRVRALDWYRDIASTSDRLRIAELWMHTPTGPVALRITEPGSAYVFNSAYLSLAEGKSPVAKIIGRVDDRESGMGIAFIWDMATQRVFKDTSANVRDFAAWRPGIAPIGKLNLAALGLRE